MLNNGTWSYYRNVPLGKPRRRRSIFRTVFLFTAGLIFAVYGLCLVELVALRWVRPPVTMVQVQRRMEAWAHHRPYRKQYVWQPLARIAPDLQHAVIAAEDGRFYQHHGIDWQEVQKVVDQDMEAGRLGRGGSTITQQLVKNLFFTTNRSILRKAVEFTLYLNVIEWGPGVYGAEAAARTWYGIPAARLNRDQAARLAAVIPSPLRRKPERMNAYSSEIERRMSQMGW